MDSETLTVEQVWEGLMGEPDFVQSVPPSAYGLWREMIEALIPVLERHLDRPLEIESYLQVKRDAFMFMLSEGWAERAINAMFGDGLMAMMAGMALDIFRATTEALAPLAQEPDAFLESRDLTFEQFLAHPGMGRLSPETMERWRQGGMTIRDLMRMQPFSVLRND